MEIHNEEFVQLTSFLINYPWHFFFSFFLESVVLRDNTYGHAQSMLKKKVKGILGLRL